MGTMIKKWIAREVVDECPVLGHSRNFGKMWGILTKKFKFLEPPPPPPKKRDRLVGQSLTMVKLKEGETDCVCFIYGGL